MSRDEAEHSGAEIRHILVAFDASPGSLEALDDAAELAAQWKTDLLGLFIEDVDLLRLASAAGATRFHYPTAKEEPLSVLNMESELRALAERAKRELGRAAAHARVSWSFRTVRGKLPEEILLAAAQADLLSLAGARWPGERTYRLGFAGRAASAGARPPFAHARRRFSTASQILVLYDRSRGAEAAFRFAARLAETYKSPLTILVPSPFDPADPKWEAELSRLRSRIHLRIRFRAIDTSTQSDFLRAVRSEHGGVLVVSGECPLLDEATVRALLRETDKLLFIVRGRSGPADAVPATK